MAEDIHIELDPEQVRRINAILLGTPQKARSVFFNALKRANESANVQGRKEVRARYAIPYATLGRYSMISQRTYSEADGVSSELRYSGDKVALYKFSVNPKNREYLNEFVLKRSNNGWRRTPRSVRATDVKASGAKAHHGFIATMKNGHTGIFIREDVTPHGKDDIMMFDPGKPGLYGKPGSPRPDHIRELFGPSIADMLDYVDAREAIQTKAQETAAKRLDHEIYRMLNGF